MTNPTDGMGVYEAASPINGSSFYTPRLQQIAAGGFSLVLNYSLLHGHIADITSYISAANTAGLKVIVALHDPVIWKTATYPTAYPELYADAGSPGTGIAFMQYVVGQLNSISNVWGWYVGDEVASTDHTTFHTYAAAVATADNTHPRLFIASASSNITSVSSSLNTFYDSCDVIGDDYYPLGDTQTAWPVPSIEAAGIASYATTHSIQPAIVLQAFSWTQYYPPARTNNWPTSAPWPSAAQMRYNRDTTEANFSPRLMLWYTYYNLLTSDDPGQHWTDLQWAANNVGSQPTEPATLASSLFFAYANQSNWQRAWSHPTGTLTPSIVSGVGVLTGATDANYFLLGAGSALRTQSRYIARVALSNNSTGKVGIVFNWKDASNFMRVDAINNATVRLVSVVAGAETVLGSGSYVPGNANRFYLKCDDTGTSYVVKVWGDQGQIEPSTLFTVAHSATPIQNYQYGVYAQLGAATDTASIYSFGAYDTNPPAASAPVYYVSTTGNDSYPGTQARPFATIGQAANVVTPGATVHVAAGTYTSGEILTPVAGTPTQRIRFIADGQVVVRTTGAAICWGCQGNYVDIIGFDLSGDSQATFGCVFYGAFNTIQNTIIHDLTATTATALEDFTYPASNNQVIGCVVKNISGNATAALGVRWTGPNDTVTNTQVFAAGQGIQTTGSNTTIANNLVANCSAGGILIWGNGTTVDTEQVNNNILDGITGGYPIRELGTTGTHSQYRDNLVWNNANGIYLQNGNLDTGTISADPLFVNYQANGSGDYHLLAGSPAINAGTSQGAPSTDCKGATRSLKGLIDIGAYLFFPTVLFPAATRRTGLFPAATRRQSA